MGSWRKIHFATCFTGVRGQNAYFFAFRTFVSDAVCQTDKLYRHTLSEARELTLLRGRRERAGFSIV